MFDVPVRPQPWERTAVAELQKYIGLRVGENCLTVDGLDDIVFHVGDTPFARDKGLGAAALEDEERVVASFGRDLVIVGGGTRGTLYAVYGFLDTYCGVRWWSDTEIDVPPKGPLDLPSLSVRRRPYFFYREIYRNHGYHELDKGPRDPRTAIANLLNGNGDGASRIPVQFGGDIGFGGPSFCHTFDRYLPYDKHGGKHPEWYALVNGRRMGGQRTAQMCLTNPEVAEAFAKEMMAWIRKDEQEYAAKGLKPPRIYDLSMNDNHGACACDNCRLAVARYGQSGVMLRMVNEVASRIAKIRQDIIVTTFAYYHTEPIPKSGVRAADNVVVKLCNTKSDVAASILSDNNRYFRQLLASWRPYAKNLFVWDYAITFNRDSDGYPFPSEFYFGDKYRYYATNAVKGVFWEQEHVYSSDMPEIKYRLLSKLLDDPFLPVESLLRESFEGFYGPAAKHVYAARLALDEARKASGAFIPWFPMPIHFSFVTPRCIAEMRDLFDEAERAAAGDERYLRRVRKTRRGFDRYAASDVAQIAAHPRYSFTVAGDEQFFAIEKSCGGRKVDDPASAFGKAARYPTSGNNGFKLPFSGAIWDPERATSCGGRSWKHPLGRGYHWYSLGECVVPRCGYVYFCNWHFQFNLGQPWLSGQKLEIRVHARFEGPEYFPDDTCESAIYLDAIDFTKP